VQASCRRKNPGKASRIMGELCGQCDHVLDPGRLVPPWLKRGGLQTFVLSTPDTPRLHKGDSVCRRVTGAPGDRISLGLGARWGGAAATETEARPYCYAALTGSEEGAPRPRIEGVPETLSQASQPGAARGALGRSRQKKRGRFLAKSWSFFRGPAAGLFVRLRDQAGGVAGRVAPFPTQCPGRGWVRHRLCGLVTSIPMARSREKDIRIHPKPPPDGVADFADRIMCRPNKPR